MVRKLLSAALLVELFAAVTAFIGASVALVVSTALCLVIERYIPQFLESYKVMTEMSWGLLEYGKDLRYSA